MAVSDGKLTAIRLRKRLRMLGLGLLELRAAHTVFSLNGELGQ